MIALSGMGVVGAALPEHPGMAAAATPKSINVRDYGAKGDGVSIDTTAFRNAIRAATNVTPVRSVFVPQGRYIIDDDNIFGDLEAPYKSGLVVQGEGREISVLILSTGGKSRWFYNNGNTSRLMFTTFADLRFEADNPNLGGGFHIHSTGHEQSFSFFRCRFHNLQTVLLMTGTVGNDSHRFFNCHITEITNKVVHWENPQAVNIDFFGTNIELIYGDMFYVGKGGGGDLRVYGGSLIMVNKPGDTTPHYLLSVEPSHFVGSGNATFQFDGIRTEMRSTQSRLVRAEDGGGFGDVFVFFNNCNLFTTQGEAREGVRIGISRRVNFMQCTLPHEFNYTIAASAMVANDFPLTGWIDFRDCRVPPDLRDKVKFATPYGRVRAQDCHEYADKKLPPKPLVSPDFDYKGAEARKQNKRDSFR
jgi:hypothetical protein